MHFTKVTIEVHPKHNPSWLNCPGYIRLHGESLVWLCGRSPNIMALSQMCDFFIWHLKKIHSKDAPTTSVQDVLGLMLLRSSWWPGGKPADSNRFRVHPVTCARYGLMCVVLCEGWTCWDSHKHLFSKSLNTSDWRTYVCGFQEV